MKVTLTLMSGAALALWLAALPTRRPAPLPTHVTSDALADAMSSHGIELEQPVVAGPAAAPVPVAYTEAAAPWRTTQH
ncbi:MAG: hypothetical protein P4L83_22280 [Nevskia sp.]|nr:hypothetical protein [Nevskia sp.]